MKAPIAVALDAPDLDTAQKWAREVSLYVSVLKIGLETYLRDGRFGVEQIKNESDCEIFLDLKLHDIPATVSGACRSVKKLQPKYLTVHASGGSEMIKAAADTLPETLIVAVTILTSLDAVSLAKIGYKSSPSQSSLDLALLAIEAGARAIVCSPQEVAIIRKNVADDVVLITPGIRSKGEEANDQQSIATPEQALKNGANLLVIGRPITSAPDVGQAAKKISEEVYNFFK